jgi:predicted DNA-binding transcriptional regulator YafY
MPKNEPIKRFFYEIEYLRKKSFPTLKEIVFYLENREIFTSVRTVERDIEQIRNNFGISVIYDPLEKGYYIDEDMSPDLQRFIRFLEIANTAGIFLSGIKQTKDFIKDIEFDLRGGLLGTENLNPLLKAVNGLKKVQFTHFNYLTNQSSKVLLAPYFLKEYLGRWYVVGMRDDNKIRTYGIDRISDLEITKETFEKNKENKARENFDSVIGLVYSYGKPELVVLSFTPRQGQYVKSLKWHHSQKTLVDNENEFRISLFVVPNYELFQQILMHGADVEVVEPQWLREKIKGKIMDALNRYNQMN